jgi:hypothetical protein
MQAQRKHERAEVFLKARWDFFADQTGAKTGYVSNVSRSGCLLKTSERIEHRRWIRMITRDENTGLHVTMVGRVVRKESRIEAVDGGRDYTLYDYGVEFTYPGYFSLLAETSLTFALSRRKRIARSCLTLNSRSSDLPGFLA